jgi:hypothetical protein
MRVMCEYFHIMVPPFIDFFSHNGPPFIDFCCIVIGWCHITSFHVANQIWPRDNQF